MWDFSKGKEKPHERTASEELDLANAYYGDGDYVNADIHYQLWQEKANARLAETDGD
jgi:hypothetical protein